MNGGPAAGGKREDPAISVLYTLSSSQLCDDGTSTGVNIFTTRDASWYMLMLMDMPSCIPYAIRPRRHLYFQRSSACLSNSSSNTVRLFSGWMARLL